MPRHGSCAPKLSDVLTGLFQSLIHNEIATAWTVTLDETLGSLGPHDLKSVRPSFEYFQRVNTLCLEQK